MNTTLYFLLVGGVDRAKIKTQSHARHVLVSS